MNIVVLDGYTLNPGDLSWDEIKACAEGGSFTVYDRSAESEVVERIGDAEAVFVNKVPLSDEVFAACPNLKYVGVLATGYNVVDIEAASKRGIAVTNTPSYGTESVVQHVFALILERTNAIHIHNESVQKGEWISCPDFCYMKAPIFELAGKTFGIFGYGAIGQKVAAVAIAFGMKVEIYTQPELKDSENTLGVKVVSLEKLFEDSDFLTLHSPLTKETRHVVNAQTLALMKPSAMIINAARGPLVDEKAIRSALDAGKLGAYAADVIEDEPMKADNPLLGAPNCIITPHIAWIAKEARARLMTIAANNLAAFLRGESLNRIV